MWIPDGRSGMCRAISRGEWPLESAIIVPCIVDLTSERGIVMTVTSKGQVTLREELLQHLGIHPGEKIAVDRVPHGRIEVRAEAKTGDIADLFDMLKRNGGAALSVDEINEIAAGDR